MRATRELVVEIGAGAGRLTGPLRDAGARVVAIELDPGLAGTLRRRFADGGVNGRLRRRAHGATPRRAVPGRRESAFGITTPLLPDAWDWVALHELAAGRR